MNRWRKPAGLAAAITLAALLPFSAFAGRFDGPFGRDSAQVWLVRPSGAPRCVVVFGHGWKVAPPSPAYPWVRQFLPWLDHLTAERCAVIFPRYQLGFGHAPGTALVDAFRRGIATGYARLGRPRLPVVALGYSYGASLALTYAANARRWHLAQPVAVDAVFPAGPIPGSPLPLLRPAIRVLIQVGDQDSEAGSAGAQAFWTWLASHPVTTKRYEIVSSHRGFAATHAAPKEATAAARAAFWAPLDALIAATRSNRRR